MSNVCAGIGVGQMEVLQEHVERRRAIHGLYCRMLGDVNGVRVQQNPNPAFDSNFLAYHYGNRPFRRSYSR